MPANLGPARTDLEFYFSNGYDVSHYLNGAVTTVACNTSSDGSTQNATSGCCFNDGRVLVGSYGISQYNCMGYIHNADLTGQQEWAVSAGPYLGYYPCAGDGATYQVDTMDYGAGMVYDSVTNTVWIATNYWTTVNTSTWPWVYTVGQWSLDGHLLKVGAPEDDGANTGTDRWVYRHGGKRGCAIDTTGRKIYWVGGNNAQFSMTCYDIAADTVVAYTGAFEQIHTDSVGVDGAMHLSFNAVTGRVVATEGMIYGSGEYSYQVSYEVNNNPNLDSAWYEQVRDTWIISDNNWTGTQGPYGQGGYSASRKLCLEVMPDGSGAIYSTLGKYLALTSNPSNPTYTGNGYGFYYVDYATDTLHPVPIPQAYFDVWASGDWPDVWLPPAVAKPNLTGLLRTNRNVFFRGRLH